MNATYDFWINALAGICGPVHDSDPQPGFYRKRVSRGGAFLPVAIWEHETEMVALVDGANKDAAEIWSYVCQHPVTEEQYRNRVETGKWHDESEAVTASLAPPPVGHNEGPQDEAEILAGKIEAASANAKDYETISDDETAKKAQSVRSRLLELSGDAVRFHKVEKEPSLEAGRAVDKKWFGMRDAAKAMADAIRTALGTYETRKEDARLALLAERVKAEEAARKAAEKAAKAGKPAPPPPPLPPAPEPEPAQTKIAGAYGRAAAVKDKRIATVTDQDAAYQSLRAHPDMIALIEKLAQRAVDAGVEVKGVTIKTVKDIR